MTDLLKKAVKAADSTDALRNRDYALDNLRFLLIFCVVFGHLLEIAAPFVGDGLMYKAIYSFHMPVFLFLFGYFVKYNPKRILFNWIVPYLVFQTLYVLFARCVLKEEVLLQYSTPYWILWYMLACTAYQILLPLYQTRSRRYQALILAAAVGLALFAGYDDTIGYHMSLSRIIVFQPCFLLGVFCRGNRDKQASFVPAAKHYAIYAASIAVICLSLVFILGFNVPSKMMFGSNSYAECNRPMWVRAALMAIAFNWLVFLWMTAKMFFGKKIRCISAIGQNTLPVFLLHGFVVKAVPVFCPWLVGSPMKVLLLTCAMLVLFGNRYARKLVDAVSLTWLEKCI